jgi:hypothetical protein
MHQDDIADGLLSSTRMSMLSMRRPVSAKQ